MTPLELAIQHQDEINRSLKKIQADAGCIRQLLVGRTVRKRKEHPEFFVTEVRQGLSGSITVYGKTASNKGKRRTVMLGGVRDIEIVEPKP